MDIATRIQNLTIEKRILLARRLTLEFDRQPETISKVPTGNEKPQRLMAYLVLSHDHTLMSRSTDSTYSSRSTGEDDVQNKEQEKKFSLSDLRIFLKQRLTHFMMPSGFIIMEKLPRTNNGKVDYRALTDSPVSENTKERESDSPTTKTQKKLQLIWAAALGIKRVGVRENFFELGGHSLLISQIVSQIRSTMGVDIALRNLFDYPTIESLGEAIDTIVWARKENLTSSDDTSSHREKFEI